MIADKGWHHVPSLVPTWLALYLVVNESSVDAKRLECDALDATLLVVSGQDGQVGLTTVVADASEGDVLYSTSRSCAVLAIVADAHVDEAALPDVFDADVVEDDVANDVVVTTVYGEASLIVGLQLALTKDIDVAVCDVVARIALLGMVDVG